MRDNRAALRDGYELEQINGRKIKIEAEVGRGANCIVYDAKCTDAINTVHNIRLKECYPNDILIERAKDGKLIPFDTSQDKFRDAKKRFIRDYQRSVDMRNKKKFTNFTINSTDIISYNKTYYTIMEFNEGRDYNQYEDASLIELFVHIKSLAELIKKYHDDEETLYLDIKPENIFIFPESEQHVLLFDFDSVIKKGELKEKVAAREFRLSFSEGFSPPEQIQGKVDKIGTHTDIFSIGALMFYKLFGRKVTLDECGIFCNYQFDKMKYLDKKYQPKLYKVLETFFRNTLSASIIPRWNRMQQLIDCLDELILLSDVDSEYLIHSFQYNTACFIGRESEIDKIYYTLSESQLVFLSGIGGIGKTELAKQYTNQYRNLYDTIVFAVFDSDIESLVNDEIIINHVERGEEESDSDYFERKIDVLRRIVTDKDLIILDNFDVDSDSNLEILFRCPCKFIITSRIDFRDYNYRQIDIDRMENPEDVFRLFYRYNDKEYDTENDDAVEKLVEYVDYHTMTVELLSKYLKVSDEAPTELLERFMEREGTANTKDIRVKQRKDHKLRAESVNSHLETLFDVSGFEETEKEIINSLSLYAGIRMKKGKFEEICLIDNLSEKLDKLIKRGWIAYNEKTDKISLHQVIQDLIYKNLSPSAENCPNIVIGMARYITADTANYSERSMKQRVFEVFMNRITGSSLSYARLCMLYGKKDKLDEAEQICLQRQEKEAYDILQRIYRKKIQIINDYNNIFESELELDEDIANQLKRIKELLDKVVTYCQKYTDDANYLIREYIDAASETEKFLSDEAYWYCNKRNSDMDSVFYKMIDMYDMATELLPKSSYTAREKEEYYKKIRKFYIDDNSLMMYQCDFFSDVEKAYWYQERIDELRNERKGEGANIVITDGGVTTYLYTDDVSCGLLAQKYEEKGNYEKAIEAYQKAYEDGDERYESVMQSIAHVYLKMGEPKKAVACFEKVLDCDKVNENNPDIYFSYTSYICVELIRILIRLQDYEKAKVYALELIHYEEPDTLKEENSYAVTNVLAAYYSLYFVEREFEKKKLLWQQCIKYYRMLQNNRIDNDILDFIVEYLSKEDVCFEEIIEILERIDKWDTRDIRERIIRDSIAKYKKAVGFDRYHVILMIAYANLFNEYPYEFIKEAENNCEKARELYLEYGLDDKYIQSLLYKTKAEILSNDEDYEYDEVLEWKRKCDYRVLAEQQLKKAVDEETKITIWRDAANSYGYADNYQMQIVCLEKSLEIVIPILNLYEFSRFDGDYECMMNDIIRAYIQLEDYEKAERYINEFYEETIEFYLEVETSDSAWQRVWKVQSIADLYTESGLKQKAVDTYLAAMYMGLEKDTTKYAMLKASDFDICRVTQMIDKLLDQAIDSDMIDSLIGFKDKLVNSRDDYYGDIHIYDKIISKINERYQNQEIEFKNEM